MAVGRMGRVINLLPLCRIQSGGLRSLAVLERHETDVEAGPFRYLPQQSSVDPVHDGPVQLSRTVEAYPVLIELRDKNILNLQIAARIEQRQSVAEAFYRARA